MHHRPVETLWHSSGSSQTKTRMSPLRFSLAPYSARLKNLDWLCFWTLPQRGIFLTVPQSEIFGLTVCRHSFVARSHTLVTSGGGQEGIVEKRGGAMPRHCARVEKPSILYRKVSQGNSSALRLFRWAMVRARQLLLSQFVVRSGSEGRERSNFGAVLELLRSRTAYGCLCLRKEKRRAPCQIFSGLPSAGCARIWSGKLLLLVGLFLPIALVCRA